jgi:RNA polymerase sigma-70 factor (ECF subfamily)
LDDQQEQEVARALQEGKTEAWQMLYEAYAKRVWHSVARRMGQGSADVADVVQETFLAAARSVRTYDSARGSLWLWLSGIARNHVALHYRQCRRHERLKHAGDRPGLDNRHVVRWLEHGQEAPPDALAAAELAELVRSTLTELPLDYETLLTAKYLDGIPVEQIARHQNCSPTAVRSKLARARRAFRRAFEKTASCAPDGRAGRHDESES